MDTSMNNTIKQFVLIPKKLPTEKKIKPKEKTKRVIVNTKIHEFTTDRLENQHTLLFETRDISNQSFVSKEIRKKIYGYKYQDIEKGIYSEEDFIKETEVIDLLQSSGMKCYYCKESVVLLYEYVRDPKQWTLERIDNSRGHNKENVEIACLQCNLRRRCMYHERYLFTKQMNIVKRG
jgi:hypothetical protein